MHHLAKGNFNNSQTIPNKEMGMIKRKIKRMHQKQAKVQF